jgi:hypothetical protein
MRRAFTKFYYAAHGERDLYAIFPISYGMLVLYNPSYVGETSCCSYKVFDEESERPHV